MEEFGKRAALTWAKCDASGPGSKSAEHILLRTFAGLSEMFLHAPLFLEEFLDLPGFLDRGLYYPPEVMGHKGRRLGLARRRGLKSLFQELWNVLNKPDTSQVHTRYAYKNVLQFISGAKLVRMPEFQGFRDYGKADGDVKLLSTNGGLNPAFLWGPDASPTVSEVLKDVAVEVGAEHELS